MCFSLFFLFYSLFVHIGTEIWFHTSNSLIDFSFNFIPFFYLFLVMFPVLSKKRSHLSSNVLNNLSFSDGISLMLLCSSVLYYSWLARFHFSFRGEDKTNSWMMLSTSVRRYTTSVSLFLDISSHNNHYLYPLNHEGIRNGKLLLALLLCLYLLYTSMWENTCPYHLFGYPEVQFI